MTNKDDAAENHLTLNDKKLKRKCRYCGPALIKRRDLDEAIRHDPQQALP